ncbi:MAG TPA: Uma2 family endonuclease [Coleofasciculaceae cyanobacterium]|jgi:Uma2 family endonuclease
MVQITHQRLTLEEFFALPEGDIIYELVNGQAVPKFHPSDMAPKFFHSSLTGALFILLGQWSQLQGRVRIEWAVSLTRNNESWVPVPDLIYISYDRLPAEWMKDEACPALPELVIEIVSVGQTFGEMTEKATDYLTAGVSCVWVVDPRAKSITAFTPEAIPKTYRGQTAIADPLLPGLSLTAEQIFQQAGLLT